MKTLVLVRHAKAVSRDKPIPDFERPLNQRGRREASLVANVVREQGAVPDVILSSPALRALETAEIFAQTYRYPPSRLMTHAAIYHAAANAADATLIPIIQALDDTHQSVLMVGHEPLWSVLAHGLAPAFTHRLPTCGAVCITFATHTWSEVDRGSGTVAWFHHPKNETITRSQARTPANHPGLTFEPLAPFKSQAFIRALNQAYTVQTDPCRITQRTYYETFDWRLYNKALALSCTDTHATVESLHDEALLAQATITAPPVFQADLPAGDLQRRLSKLLGWRALCPLITLSTESQTWRILNRDDKTIARLVLAHHHLGPHPTHALVTQLRIDPVRGYDKPARKLRQWLLRQGCAPAHHSLYSRALTAIGRTPNDYSAKLQLQFDPKMRADAAVQHLLRFLHRVMRQNEAGIIADLDTEYLHDYRIALRRTRAAIGQLRAVFPNREHQHFKRAFADLGALTNPLRDLDVYVLQQSAFEAKLPDHLRPDINPLFDHLRQNRTKTHATLVRQLRTPKYHTLMQDWETFLTRTPGATADPEWNAPHAAHPIRKVARQRIRKTCRTVIALGTPLLEQHALSQLDDNNLHKLRIACKKLRYLMEFFTCLFKPQDIEPLIKQLRQLQNNLGDFHDACIQQDSLHAVAEQWRATDHPQQHRTLRAMDSLMGLLDADKQALCARFPQQFKAFVASSTQAQL